MNDWHTEIEKITKIQELAHQRGDDPGVKRQHEKGRLTVRERIALLLDNDTFQEIGPNAGSGETDERGNQISFTPANFVLGFGKIDGNRCVVAGEDLSLIHI